MDVPAASIKSAERVLDICEALAEGERSRATLAELARRLEIPKSSLHGLLRVLVARRYLTFEPDSRSFRLGPRVLGLASAYLSGFDLHGAARPVMATLARLTDETITLDIPHGAEMVTIAREAGRQPIRVFTRVGTPFPSYATASGKVFLASLPTEALEAFFPNPDLPPITARTIRTVEQLRAELATVRQAGVAYAHGEISDGVEAVAVPVFEHDQRLAAVLDVLVPAQRARPGHLQRIERVLVAAAAVTSARMGGPIAHANLVLDVETYLEQIWLANGPAELERRAT